MNNPKANPGNPRKRIAARRVGRRNRRAFTLIETMTALFVMATALLPTLLLCLGSYRTAQQAQAQTVAYLMAQKQIEAVRCLPWEARETGGTVPITVAADSSDQVFPPGMANTSLGFRGTVCVTRVSPTMQQVYVRVWWPSLVAHGKTSDVCLDTLLTQVP